MVDAIMIITPLLGPDVQFDNLMILADRIITLAQSDS